MTSKILESYEKIVSQTITNVERGEYSNPKKIVADIQRELNDLIGLRLVTADDVQGFRERLDECLRQYCTLTQ